MDILAWVLPGRLKSNLRKGIEELAEASRQQTGQQGLPPHRAALWEALSSEAAEITRQLLVRNTEKTLDWGLKRHRRRVNQPRLVAIYWWMLLYQLVLFRNRGIDGYAKEDEFWELYSVAQRFLEYLNAHSTESVAVAPEPWEGKWTSQYSLEASLGLYNRVMQLLHLYTDEERRINHVSLFTTATERGYDARVRPAVLGRASSPGQGR